MVGYGALLGFSIKRRASNDPRRRIGLPRYAQSDAMSSTAAMSFCHGFCIVF